MFVRRVAGPSRFTGHVTIGNVPVKARICKHTLEILPAGTQRSQIRAASSGSAVIPAQADTSNMTQTEKMEQQRSNFVQMDRIGSRGAARQTLDEFALPTQDVDLIPSRPSDMKELYLWYYPSDLFTWPFFYRKLWYPWNWDRRRIIRFWHPANWSFSFPNPIAYYEEWREKGPKALKLWTRRVDNDYKNFEAMLLMAQHQRFPEYEWPAPSLARRTWQFNVPTWEVGKQTVRNWQLLKRENSLLTDLSAGDDSPLRRILLDAADVYIAMNTAVSEGKTSNLARYADKSYITELENRAKRITQYRKADTPVNYQWEFGHWINPPQCLSIRAVDYFAGHSKAYITGDRLYVNMLVKLESVQRITITESFRNPASGELQYRKPEVQEREVTEYLVLDVRTWVPGRLPKFIQEIFEGENLTYEVHTVDPSQVDAKPATAESTSDTAGAPAPA